MDRLYGPIMDKEYAQLVIKYTQRIHLKLKME